MLGRLIPARFRRQHPRSPLKPEASEISRRVRDDRLTYLTEAKFANLEGCAEAVEREGIPGDFYEAGVALGGSAIVLADLMAENRAFRGYDVFDQIPPPSDRDEDDAHSRYSTIAEGKSEGIDGDVYYGYVEDLLLEVTRSFERYGLEVDGERIALLKGLFEDTLEPDRPIALAHIDCDWHDPVTLCLERIYPQLSPGGFLILDDYNNFAGCRTATDHFLATHDDVEVVTADSNLVARRAL